LIVDLCCIAVSFSLSLYVSLSLQFFKELIVAVMVMSFSLLAAVAAVAMTSL